MEGSQLARDSVMPAGRPTEYDPKKTAKQAKKACLMGATDKDLADFFEVSETTINNWKNQHPEFLESIKRGKEVADANVAKSLYDRAMGYEHPEVHVSNYQGAITLTPLVKRYPPDTTAGIFWMKNRQPDKWSDRRQTEITGKGGGPVQILPFEFVDAEPETSEED